MTDLLGYLLLVAVGGIVSQPDYQWIFWATLALCVVGISLAGSRTFARYTAKAVSRTPYFWRLAGKVEGAFESTRLLLSPREVIARLRAVLRRSNPSLDSEALQYRDINMDLAGHKVTRGTRTLKLGPTEFRLLRCFMEQPGRVFSREQLLDKVWGYDAAIEPRTVDVHIRRLRKALNGPDELDLIRTVRSAGYALDEDG